jgi:phosphoglycerate dehydrogenase-like enzyme
MIPERRRISQSEAEGIQAALDRASVAPVDSPLNAAIPDLNVVARCECGCASVDFDAPTYEAHGVASGA